MVKQTVLIVGATGSTGSSFLEGLLNSGNFTVIAGVRPSSASKPEVTALKSRGVEVRILDLETWTVDQLAEQLKGVDTVISTIDYSQLEHQRPLVDAAKKAGVKRFVPDDWPSARVRGVRNFYDVKLGIHDYIKDVGIGYTFIDVGWWMQVVLPFSDPSRAPIPVFFELFKIRYGRGMSRPQLPIATTLAKEVTQNEAFALARRFSGKELEGTNLSADELLQKTRQSKGFVEESLTQYAYSMWIHGDNTVENAKKPEYGGALDARELYPDKAAKVSRGICQGTKLVP